MWRREVEKPYAFGVNLESVGDTVPGTLEAYRQAQYDVLSVLIAREKRIERPPDDRTTARGWALSY